MVIENLFGFIGFMQVGAFQDNLLTSPFFVNIILPFILIFTLIFAILQKSKILGDGKRQIDAIVSFAIALIVISFGNAVGIITSLIPLLAVSVVVILVFLIMFAMLFQGDDKFRLHVGVKWVIGIMIAIVVITSVLISTGAWDYVYFELFLGGASGVILTNIIFIVMIAAAVAVVVWPSKNSSESSSTD